MIVERFIGDYSTNSHADDDIFKVGNIRHMKHCIGLFPSDTLYIIIDASGNPNDIR
jgi:hypothetical protein